MNSTRFDFDLPFPLPKPSWPYSTPTTPTAPRHVGHVGPVRQAKSLAQLSIKTIAQSELKRSDGAALRDLGFELPRHLSRIPYSRPTPYLLSKMKIKYRRRSKANLSQAGSSGGLSSFPSLIITTDPGEFEEWVQLQRAQLATSEPDYPEDADEDFDDGGSVELVGSYPRSPEV